MSKIIEIEELGFPKSLIIREKSLVSELIDTKDLVNELNEQLRQYNVVGRSEQLVYQESILDCPYDFTSRCTLGRCDCKPKAN